MSEASYTFSLGQAGDAPKGVLVFTMQSVSATEVATAVTYGGETLEKVPNGTAADTSTEPGRVTAWFLGHDVPSGAQSVVVTRTNNTTVQYAVGFLIGAATPYTEIKGTPVLQQENGTISAVTVDDGLASGNVSIALAAAFSGSATAPTGATNMTTAQQMSLSSQSFGAAYETTPTYGSRSRGCSGANDDRAHVVLCVGEAKIFLVGVTSFDTTGTSATVTAPSGIEDDDIILITGYADNPTITPTCSGFTRKFYARLFCFYKRASSESGNYTLSLSPSAAAVAGHCTVWRGCVASGDPIEDYDNTAYTTSNTTVRCYSIDPTTDFDMLIAFGLAGGYSASEENTDPTGMIQFADDFDSSWGENYFGAYTTRPAAGSTGDKDFTVVNASTDKAGALLCLIPAATSTTWNVSGAVTMTAELDGAIKLRQLISGDVDATMALSAAIKLRQLIAGEIEAASSLSAAAVRVQLTSGAVGLATSVSADPDAVGVVAGALGLTGEIEAVPVLIGLASGELVAGTVVEGTARVTAMVSGAVSAVTVLYGALEEGGVWFVRGAIDLLTGLDGALRWKANVSGALGAVTAVSAAPVKVAVGAGSLDMAASLAGSVLYTGICSGVMLLVPEFNALPVAVYDVSGDVDAVTALSGGAVLVKLVSGEVVLATELDGSIARVHPVAGAVSLAALLAGSAREVGIASGALGLIGGLSGALKQKSYLSGVLPLYMDLDGKLYYGGTDAGPVPQRFLTCPRCSARYSDRMMTVCRRCRYPLTEAHYR